MNLNEAARRLVSEGWTEEEIPDDLAAAIKGGAIAWEELRAAVGVVLAEQYLTAHGLTAGAALEADLLAGPNPEIFCPPPDVREKMNAIRRGVDIGRGVAQALVTDEGLTPDAAIPERLAELAGGELVDAIREAARMAVARDGNFAWLGWAFAYDAGGVLTPDFEEFYELAAPFRLTDEERVAGTREYIGDAPPLRTWLAGRGWRGAGKDVRRHLNTMAQGNPAAAGRRKGADGADVVTVDALRPNRMVPVAVLGIGAPAQFWERKGDRDARVTVPPLSVVERDAVHAVLRIYSSPYESGKVWEGWREVSWGTFLKAAGVESKQNMEVRRILKALGELRRREVRYVRQKPDGSGSVGMTSILQGVEFDYAEGDERAAAEWTAGGEWRGKAPVRVRVMLSEPMRILKAARTWTVEHDEAIAAAVKVLRNGRRDKLDYALRDELFRIREGGTGLARLNREEFMETFKGADVVARLRARRQYGAKVEAPYLKAVEVLVKAGVVVMACLESPTRSGLRDVFRVVDPGLPGR